MVKSVLALLKMEVSELIREASMTDSISPRSPGAEPKEKVREDHSANETIKKAPTVGHEVHHQLGIGDVAAAHSRSAVLFTLDWIHTSHHIWTEMDKISSTAPPSCQIRKSKHTSIEDPADHAGEHHEEHGQNL